ARDNFSLTALANGKVLASSRWTPVSAELYDPATDSWSPTGDAVDYHSSATLLPSGKVLAVGGGQTSTNAELYDPASGTWSATGNPVVSRSGQTATLLKT